MPSIPQSDAPSTLSRPLPFEGPQPHRDESGRWEAPFTGDLNSNPRLRRLRGFESAYLPDERDVQIWLPPSYGTEPDRHFPVLYLHDGQNLMDARTSYIPGRTWCAHTTADLLAEGERIEPLILVGVDNTGVRRMAEYTPSRDKHYGGGEGALYGRLLVDELKPLIDTSFRTLPGRENTGLAGSSLGGLISLSLGLDYPQVFGKLGVLSPSVWWNNREMLARVADRVAARRRAPVNARGSALVNTEPPVPRPRIWLDMGMAEGLRHLRDTDLLFHRLVTYGWREGIDLRYLRVPGGLHDEDAWARRFGRVLEWLFPPTALPVCTPAPPVIPSAPR